MSGPEADTRLGFHLHRPFLYGGLLYATAIALISGIVAWIGPLPAAIAFSILLALSVQAVCVIVWTLGLPEPVLCLDRHGIHDRRLTRSPIPWNAVSAIHPVRKLWPISLDPPDAIMVDLRDAANDRPSLVPWRVRLVYLGPYGLTGGRDVVMNLHGIRSEMSTSRHDIAKRMADFAAPHIRNSLPGTRAGNRRAPLTA